MKQTRRGVLRSIGAGTAVAVGGVGAASAAPPRDGDTIVDVAVDADGFDVLVAAVKEAGLVETLSGNRQLTVFAPKDDAFSGAGITVENVDEVDDEFLLNVLTYHVIPGRRKEKSIVNASQLPTLNGAKIDVAGTNLNGDQADIVDTNNEASNGFVHVIKNGVLLP
jgi:uncharacterized surface protein with fasciclin (FAS1) repeats